MPLSLFKGERTFTLEPSAGGVAFTMREVYSGVLSPMIVKSIPDLQPAFDYARQSHKVDLSENGAVFEADDMELTLHWARSPDIAQGDSDVTIERHGEGAVQLREMFDGPGAWIAILEAFGKRAEQGL